MNPHLNDFPRVRGWFPQNEGPTPLGWFPLSLESNPRRVEIPLRPRFLRFKVTPQETTIFCGSPNKKETRTRSPSSALLPFVGEGSPTKIDYKKIGYQLILTSLLEDLANINLCHAEPTVSGGILVLHLRRRL